METARRQKLNRAILTTIGYATRIFLVVMAAIMAALSLTCMVLTFGGDFISLIGCVGFGFCAWTAWCAKDAIPLN